MIFVYSFISLLLFGLTSCGPLDPLNAAVALGAEANVLTEGAADGGDVIKKGESGANAGSVLVQNILTTITDFIKNIGPGNLLGAGVSGSKGTGETAKVPKTGTKGGATTKVEEAEAGNAEAGAGAEAGAEKDATVADPAAPVADPAAPVADPAAPVADPAAPVAAAKAPAAGEAEAAPVAAEADAAATATV